MRERRDSNPQPPADKTTPRTPRRFARGALCQLSYTPPPQHCTASNGVLTGRLGVSSMLLPFVTYATRLLAEALRRRQAAREREADYEQKCTVLYPCTYAACGSRVSVKIEEADLRFVQRCALCQPVSVEFLQGRFRRGAENRPLERDGGAPVVEFDGGDLVLEEGGIVGHAPRDRFPGYAGEAGERPTREGRETCPGVGLQERFFLREGVAQGGADRLIDAAIWRGF